MADERGDEKELCCKEFRCRISNGHIGMNLVIWGGWWAGQNHVSNSDGGGH